jgi:hypothetical protein
MLMAVAQPGGKKSAPLLSLPGQKSSAVRPALPRQASAMMPALGGTDTTASSVGMVG